MTSVLLMLFGFVAVGLAGRRRPGVSYAAVGVLILAYVAYAYYRG